MLRQKVCDSSCGKCIYFCMVGYYGCCNYIFMRDKRRPCPPGKGCTVKETKRKKGTGGQQMDNKSKFHPGTRFRGNGNGAMFEVVRIDKHNAILKNMATGIIFAYGLRALEKCDVTILEVRHAD